MKTAIPSDCVASFVAQMYSSSNTTLMDVTSVTCTQEMLERIVESLPHSTTTLLNNLQTECVQSLMREFENANHMFKDVDTPFKTNKYFSEKFDLVKTCRQVPKYISVIETDARKFPFQVKSKLKTKCLNLYLTYCLEHVLNTVVFS